MGVKSALAKPCGFMALTGHNITGKGKHEENIFEATGRKIQVEERKKNEEEVKTTVPPFASLALLSASSMVIFVLEQDSILLEMGAIKVALRASSFSTHQKCSSALLWGWPVRKAEDGTLCPCEKGGGSNNTCARLHSWSAAG